MSNLHDQITALTQKTVYELEKARAQSEAIQKTHNLRASLIGFYKRQPIPARFFLLGCHDFNMIERDNKLQYFSFRYIFKQLPIFN